MTLIDKDLMEKHIMESKVFTRYFKELVQSLIWGEKTIDAVEVVHAGWQSHGDFFTSYLKCPVCEKSICAYADNGDGQRFDFCPNCGAKMDGHKKDVM